MAEASSFELKIQKLLTQKQPLEKTVEQLLADLDWSQLNDIEMKSACSFMLAAGAPAKLTAALSENISKLSRFPWPYFMEALLRSQSNLPQKLEEAILAGAEEQGLLMELARLPDLDQARPNLKNLRLQRKKEIMQKQYEHRTELFQQLDFFKSQNLWDQAEGQLTKIKKYFPQDPDIQDEQNLITEHQALNLLNRKPKRSRRQMNRPTAFTAVETQILEAVATSQLSFQDSSEKSIESDLPIDFAVSHLMWENFDQALEFLETLESSPSRDWLKAELLLFGRRHVDLLEHLRELELQYAHDSETIFACTFLRAQALWGLGQKFQAQEMLKSLLQYKHDYRTAASLLNEWQEDDE